MHSEGQTILTELPTGGEYNVESFFDIMYEIDFEGAPGSVLEGMSGLTTGEVRMETGAPIQTTGACCTPDGSCTVTEEADCGIGFEWLAGEAERYQQKVHS